MVVLFGDVGAAVLRAVAPAPYSYAVHGTVRVDDAPTAYIATPKSPDEPSVVLVPQPTWLRSDQAAPLAQALLGLRPSSIAMVSAYVPRLYLGATEHDAPLRYLAHVPPGTHAPKRWPHAPSAPYQPWGVPNTVSGAPAALMAEAVLQRHPALLLLVPSDRAPLPTPGWTPPRLVVPYDLQHLPDEEAHARLAHHVEALDPQLVLLLRALLPAPETEARHSLHRVAAQHLLAAQARVHAGSVGDGGMYV